MLTPTEEVALVHVLVADVDSPVDFDVEQLWIAESQRRYGAYLRGELGTVVGDEAMANVRNRAKMIESKS